MSKRELQRALRQQAAKIGNNRTDTNMTEIITDIQHLTRCYKQERRREKWREWWIGFWRDWNDPRRPRLFW